MVLGSWSVRGPWSVPGPSYKVSARQSRDQGPRTMNRPRAADGPGTKHQVPRTVERCLRSTYRTTSHPVGLNFDPSGSFLNVELTMRGWPPSSIDVITVRYCTPKSWCGMKYSVIVADRKSTRLNSSHLVTSYAVFCLTKNAATQNAQ